MRSEKITNGAGVLAVALSFPLAVIRRVLNLPMALVDMMEKHGTEN